jgi:hypothetical protein
MKWVTREHVHFDRVVAAWLIKRFVDKDASFEFLAATRLSERSVESTPFGMANVELSDPSDGAGTTFHKIVGKYRLHDAALESMDLIVTAAVGYVQRGLEPSDLYGRIALGVLATAEGILLLSTSDQDTIERSMTLYDGIYARMQADALLKSRQEHKPANAMSQGLWETVFVVALTMHLRPRGKRLGPGTTLSVTDSFDALIARLRARAN